MTIATALSIAAMFWGQPACGQPNVQWFYSDADVFGSSVVGGGPVHQGVYQSDGCTIFLNSRKVTQYGDDIQDLTICSTVVHEWGHLMGMQHSTDPDNIMYPYNAVSPDCLNWIADHKEKLAAAHRRALRLLRRHRRHG